jgi:mRNA interferase MazF
MKKGEIWRVLIPAAPGHAQSGERPAIILQELAFNNSLPTTLIVPLTGQLAASRFDGTLVIQPDKQNGLSAPSVALVFQMRTLDQRRCLKQIGTLDAATLDQIFDVLDKLTGS